VTGELTGKRIGTSAAVRAVLSFIAVAMLLSFPANKAHRFEIHFRTPEIRRAIERITFLAQPELTGAEHIRTRTFLQAYWWCLGRRFSPSPLQTFLSFRNPARSLPVTL
jgi:hypothetical protein